MKTKLLSITLFIFSISFSNAQSIGFLGDFSGWADDVNMTTTDNITFTLNNYYLPATGLKFRQDDMWTNNWGGDTFPSGTWSSNNIPVTAGFYNISIDIGSTAYNFVPVAPSDQSVSIIGEFNGWSADVMLTTSDYINYSASNVALTAGGLKFRRNASWSTNYGGTTLSGTAVPSSGDNIPIPANSNYNISFNIDTFAYTITDATLGVDDQSNTINVRYINGALELSNYNGLVSITIYDITGRQLNTFDDVINSNTYRKTLEIPKHQLSFIRIEGNNFKKTLKVISE